MRLFVVVALIALALGWCLPDLRRVVGTPFGFYGLGLTRSTVTRVDAGGPADRAGIRVGDRLTIGDSSPLAHYELTRGVAPYPGVALTVTVTRGPASRQLRLIAEPESASERAFVGLRFALAFLTIGVATALLLSRPDLAAWGFFIYCLTVISLPGAASTMALPWSFRYISVIQGDALLQAGQVGGVLFALAFGRTALSGWRRNAIVALAVAAAASTTMDAVTTVSGALASASDRFSYWLTVVCLVGMLVGFIDSYRSDSGAARQRLRWMIGALLITVPANLIASTYWPGRISYGELVTLISLQVLLPLTAAYALFRKRVVDLDFVISRTLVYGTLTAGLIVVFSVLDAVLARTFAESQVSLTIDIAIALLLGFSLNSAHRHIDDVIDRVLFRERHRAELQMERSAASIVHATSEATIDDTIVRLPTHALKLAGAALYRVAGSAFARSAADGRLAASAPILDANDPLVLVLKAELRAVRIDSVPLTSLRAVGVSVEPVLAIPISMRGELNGFVIYAAHESGADIDPDEEHAIESLARSAAVAYDHLEVAVLRARLTALEALVLSKPASQPT